MAFLVLIACLLVGQLIGRSGRAPAKLVPALNAWVMNVALPAVVLELVPSIRFDARLWFLPASQWMGFAMSWLLIALIGARKQWPRARIGMLVLVCGLANTSFLGYPLVEALRGREGLKLAVVADQVGAFLTLGVGGIVVASIYSGQNASVAHVAKRIATFPPFLALVAALVVCAMPPLASPAVDALHWIGRTLTPVALISVGVQLKFAASPGELRLMIFALGWKLLALPLILMLIGLSLGVRGLFLDVSILQIAMAPMISAVILAERHELEPRLAVTLLGWGIAISLASVPMWSAVLNALR